MVTVVKKNYNLLILLGHFCKQVKYSTLVLNSIWHAEFYRYLLIRSYVDFND